MILLPVTARWDTKKGLIADSIPKDLHPRLPLVLVRGVLYADVDKTGIFECPVYITTKRGDSPPYGVYCFIATLKTNVEINKYLHTATTCPQHTHSHVN